MSKTEEYGTNQNQEKLKRLEKQYTDAVYEPGKTADDMLSVIKNVIEDESLSPKDKKKLFALFADDNEMSRSDIDSGAESDTRLNEFEKKTEEYLAKRRIDGVENPFENDILNIIKASHPDMVIGKTQQPTTSHSELPSSIKKDLVMVAAASAFNNNLKVDQNFLAKELTNEAKKNLGSEAAKNPEVKELTKTIVNAASEEVKHPGKNVERNERLFKKLGKLINTAWEKIKKFFDKDVKRQREAQQGKTNIPSQSR